MTNTTTNTTTELVWVLTVEIQYWHHTMWNVAGVYTSEEGAHAASKTLRQDNPDIVDSEVEPFAPIGEDR